VTRKFTNLKLSLMPYLAGLAEQASGEGVPMMRPMVLEFPEDRGAHTVDTQFMLGDALCVSPVFSPDGGCETYLPTSGWRHLLDGHLAGPGWVRETYGFDSLGVFVRPGTVLPLGAVDDTPEYAWAEGVTLVAHDLPEGYDQVIRVPGGTGQGATFRVRREGSTLVASSADASAGWALRVAGSGQAVSADGAGEVRAELA